MINIFGKKFYTEKELKNELIDLGIEMMKLQNNIVKHIIERQVTKIKKFNNDILDHKIEIKQGKKKYKVIEVETYNLIYEEYFGE